MKEDAIEIVVALTRLLAQARQRLNAYRGDSGGNPDALDDNIKRWTNNVIAIAHLRDSLERTVVDL